MHSFKLFFRSIKLIIPLALLLSVSACEDDVEGECPTIVTSEVTSITSNSAQCGGLVTSNGGLAILDKGLVYANFPNPTIENHQFKIPSGTFSNDFSLSMTGLEENTTYYVRAFATNDMGTGHGSLKTFQTTKITLPEIEITEIYDLSNIHAALRLEVIDNGNADLSDVGMCWNTSGNPNVDDNSVYSTNTFPSNTYLLYAYELSQNTTYYFRPFAENSVGFQYGNEFQVTTTNVELNSIPGSGATDPDGNFYESIILANGQEWMAENLKTSKFSNGVSIPHLETDSEWVNEADESGYCYYQNNSFYQNIHGNLYSYATIINSNNVCPQGWHVPTTTEWQNLLEYVRLAYPAGAALKSLDFWSIPNNGALDAINFSATGGGFRAQGTGDFQNLEDFGYWWASTGNNRIQFSAGGYEGGPSPGGSNMGFSVRCVKD